MRFLSSLTASVDQRDSLADMPTIHPESAGSNLAYSGDSTSPGTKSYTLPRRTRILVDGYLMKE